MPLGRSATARLSSKLAFALTVLLSLIVGPSQQAGSNDESSFYEFMRPRLGYFSQYDQSSPYARIYEQYFENVIRNNDKAMESITTDDWRKVRPTGELCIDFLMGLKVKSYVMRKPYEIIILDACLDWLLSDSDSARSEERSLDLQRLDSSRKTALKMLEKDEKLKEIFGSTQFAGAKLPAKLLGDIYEYLVKLLQVYNGNPKNGCHSLWLEAYNDFIDEVYVADCEDEENCNFYGGLEGSERDSYLRMIVESTKEASRTCYNVMQAQMRGLMETEFEHSNSGPTSLTKRLMKTQVSRQIEREKWAREMVTILQLASGIDQDSPVNLGDVVLALDKIKNGDEETTQRFTRALSEYATHNVDLKDSANDPSGRGRFGRAMTKLCRPYIDYKKFLAATGGINTDDDDKERKPFDFYNLIYSLVRITNHEALLGVSKEHFEEDVLKNRWEALYLATFACQIISTTWGELNYETNVGSFNVLLRPDSSIMISDWPIESLQQRLPHLYPKSGVGAAIKSISDGSKLSGPGSKPKAMFGKKFKLNFLKPHEHGKRPEAQAEQAVTSPPAPLPGLASLLESPAKPPAESLVTRQNRVASVPTSAPLPASSLVQPARESARDAPIMSLDTILMYKKLHGRYPKLPDYYKKIYPELPDDLSGEYPKELGLAPSTTARPAPSVPSFAMPSKKPTKPDYGQLSGLKF